MSAYRVQALMSYLSCPASRKFVTARSAWVYVHVYMCNHVCIYIYVSITTYHICIYIYTH